MKPGGWSRRDCIAMSLAGQSHLRVGRVNQDAAALWVWDPESPSPPRCAGSAAAWGPKDSLSVALADLAGELDTPFIAAAVSDGHGSAMYDRSDRGSAFAVWLSLHLSLLVTAKSAEAGSSATKWLGSEGTQQLVSQWRELAEQDLSEMVDTRDPHELVDRYGATLLGCVVSGQVTAFWQIGDGDMVVLDHDGLVRRPTPLTEVFLGTATNSLCEAGAEDRFRVWVEHGPPAKGETVILASDGIANSFADDTGFDEFVVAAMRRASQLGNSFESALQRWIARSSCFSGDDVSIIVISPTKEGAVAGPTNTCNQEGDDIE